MKLSIVIPFYNEEENAEAVLREARAAQPDAEIVAVNDGSTDRTAEIIASLPDIRLINFPRNLGQSAALYAGLMQARGDFLVPMDGDGQNDPADIQHLLARRDEFDVVCGYRKNRQDTWSIRTASKIANRTRQLFTNDGIRDAGCTLKLFRREHMRLFTPFNEMQCYMMAMLRRNGLRIGEIPVNHRARKFGRSKYTIARRAWRGIWDLLGVAWLLRRNIAWPEGLPRPDSR
jgi:dolichol-phosphate mannosyltransferase